MSSRPQTSKAARPAPVPVISRRVQEQNFEAGRLEPSFSPAIRVMNSLQATADNIEKVASWANEKLAPISFDSNIEQDKLEQTDSMPSYFSDLDFAIGRINQALQRLEKAVNQVAI